MIRELLIQFGLLQPSSNDIINKLFKNNFTKSELKDLSKIWSIKIKPINSDIYGIMLSHASYDDNKGSIRIQYHHNSDFVVPNCSDIAKYLPEIMDAIKEGKLRLPIEVSKYNEHIRQRQEFYDQERTCRTKLWEYINK